MLFCQRTHKTH